MKDLFCQLLLWCSPNGDFLFLSSPLYLLMKILLEVQAGLSPFIYLDDYVSMDPWILFYPMGKNPILSLSVFLKLLQLWSWRVLQVSSRISPHLPPPFLFKYFLTLWHKLLQTYLVSSCTIHGINHFAKEPWFLLLDDGVKIWAIGTLIATGVFLALSTELGNTYVYTNPHMNTYLYFCIYL